MSNASQIEFLLSQIRNSSGSLAGGTVTFYAAGTTTLKTIWADRAKAATAANPYTIPANGALELYAEGLYDVLIKNSAGTTIYTLDDLSYQDTSTTASPTFNDLTLTQATLGNAVQTLSSTSTGDDPTVTTKQYRTTTTNATKTTLWTETPTDDKVTTYTAHVIARQTAGTAGTAGDGDSWWLRYTVHRVSGTTTEIGSFTIGPDEQAWTVEFEIDGAAVDLNVTGEANKTITWHLSQVDIMNVGS